MNPKRVVITGLGAVTPLGNDVSSTWTGLTSGKSGAARITRFDPRNLKTQFACEVKGFDPLEHFDRKSVRKIDLYTQFGTVSAREAVKDSGLDFEKEDTAKIGVIFSSGIGGLWTFQDEVAGLNLDEEPRINPFFIPKMIANMAAGYISMEYGLRGPNFATLSACASSTNSIISALDQIRLGRATVMLAGGSEAAINYTGIGGFNALTALSTRNDSPETASRPFSASRDGFVMGEGGVTLILEELEHAKARGAKIYAELLGGGMSADAYHLTASHPEGLGAKIVMENALRESGLKTSDIDYINVHGTSTPVGDISEVKAILDVFGDDAYRINISSTKSMTGHLLGAAGALEAMACILAIRDGIVPPTINHAPDDNDTEIDSKLNFTFNEAQKRDIRYALSNTFGFGGHNASAVFGKYEA
ncbi:MAG: beta-ketoacyl-ACP synthase II [Porphyromonas sp.]|nr:beta-ketoacyl-ACP synthase II [Bacteroidales bacterium]MDY3100862.1 beta-ketoacyl-ACP synthase II [Porphyromonas sp.]